ncbi:MAG: DUF6152 family protein [Steroidobacteraceae bacterium]
MSSVYDRTKLLTVKGTVKTFQWTNPHVVNLGHGVGA